MTDPMVRRARFFDLRFAIASLFTLFGVIVTITGLTASDEEIAKSEGVNLSLWTGLGMLVLAGVFWLWLFIAPLEIPQGHEETPSDGPDGASEPPLEP